MNYFYLIRHGDKKSVIGDPPLTDLGKKQAEYTGKYLKKFAISHIYSSPFKRSKQTAEIVANILNLKVIYDDRLKERMNWDSKYKSFEEFLKIWEKTEKDRDYQPKIGDSSRKSGQRMESIINDLSNKHPKSHIVLSTHGGIIADFLLNVFSEKEIRKFVPDFVEERAVRECSITKIAKDRNGLKLLELASVEHLPFPIK